ncbi:MAG: DNA-processing protein DprA [Candidatus Eisenbacteria bacterium]
MMATAELLALALLPRFTPRRARALRELFQSGRTSTELALVDAGTIAACQGVLASIGARFLADEEPDFPEELREIPDPPLHLFVRGTLPPRALAPRVGIIGARAASEAGKEIAFVLGRDLALAGCVIVSGLARGIDGEAHRGALAADGCTLAVLGSGLDICYPSEHRALFDAIPKRGALLSEFPPGTPPLAHHFPMRNRILSGLVDLLIVVEGTEKSGARSTVDHALDQGREVWAVPRDILLAGSALPNRLLADGAPPVRSANDVLLAVRESRAAAGHGGRGPNVDLAEEILRVTEGGARSLDELVQALPSRAVAEIQAVLSTLELEGAITRRHDGSIGRRVAAPR